MTDRLAYARNMEEAVRAKFFPDQPTLKLDETERAVPGGGQRPASMADNEPLGNPDIDPTAESPSESMDS